MSIHKKGRRQARQKNNHLAKIGRPGMPKKRSSDTLAKRQAKLIADLHARRARGAKF